jgi:chemotaxis protein methyltransferase CheR
VISDSEDPIGAAHRVILARIGHLVPKLYDERIARGLNDAKALLNAPSVQHVLSDLERLSVDTPAWQAVIAAITIGETNFLRHPEWFSAIRSTSLEPLVEERSAAGTKRIDIWSAGCSTGEEPYTLAMMLEELVPDRDGWSIRIVATDVNESRLAQAREGIYGNWSLRELPAPTLARNFTQVERGRRQLSRHIRDMVDFRLFNLSSDLHADREESLDKFDLILCRNVLIYFSPPDQLAVAAGLVKRLAPRGWLAVSPAEAVADWYKPLKSVNLPAAILFHNVPVAAKKPAWARHIQAPDPSHPVPKPIDAVRPRAPAPAETIATPLAATETDPVARARAYADRGEYEEARRICEAHLAADGPDFDSYLMLATISLEAGDLAAALEAGRGATYLDPDSPASHYVLGTVLHRQGALEAAQRKMAVVLKLLQLLPAEALISRHFHATVGELRANARGYLGLSVAA